ncbi:MAG: indole-3-glycerol phosphate synthase TrpC [Nitrospirae bacterium]|nr:indole-3-glycerol phosphate synthase TrpC [Nitrospirota bacterium]
MSILNTIIARKKERLSHAKAAASMAHLKTSLKDIPLPFDFERAIKRTAGQIHLIAEVKKASPSKGLIRQDFNHKTIAAVYKEKKVNAISVLTEEDFFQGRLEFLDEVKNISLLPVLRKDFIFDEYQIYEARANQADAILLIAAILGEKQAEEYLHVSRELGMAVLFEVHDHQELEMALRINVPIIGINNRNLKTLQIDMNTTLELKKEIPADKIIVSESGIKTRDDVLKLEQAGIDAMLIGTSFMESADIGRKIGELRGT